MNGNVVHGDLSMARGSVLRIEDGKNMLVYIWDGGVWLTQEGDGLDRYLVTGQWFMLNRDGVTVIHSSGRSTLTLTAAQPVRYAKRVTLTPAGGAPARILYDATHETPTIIHRLRIAATRLRAAVFAPRSAAGRA